MKIVQPIFNKVYALFLLLFGVHQILEANYWSHWLLRSYFDDLLVLPIILPISLSALRLIFNAKDLTLGFPLIIIAIIMLTVVFEWVLPHYSSQYTSDLIDPLCYLFGGLIYWIYEQKVVQRDLEK